jgi:hypothetical protein
MRVYIFDWINNEYEYKQTLVVEKNRRAAMKLFVAQYKDNIDNDSGWSVSNIPLRKSFIEELLV